MLRLKPNCIGYWDSACFSRAVQDVKSSDSSESMSFLELSKVILLAVPVSSFRFSMSSNTFETKDSLFSVDW